MSTPRKKFNTYTSPYGKPVQQYPSQSEDYISLDMGGMSQPQQAGSNEKTPGGYMNTKYFSNSISKSNRGKNLFSNTAGNRYNRPNYNNQQDRYTPRKNDQQERYTPRKNDYQQQERYTPRKNDYQQERYTPRKNNESYQNRNQHNVTQGSPSISAYCHPSMTQDPWLELIERAQAIEKSKISVKTSPSQNDTTEAEETSMPDSDENDESGDSIASE